MKSNFFGLLAILFIATSCNGQAGVHRLAPDNFEKKLNETPDKIILDVRTQDEYKKGHLPDAVIIDYYKADFKNRLNALDKSKPVFVYCAAGGRSNTSTKILRELGFKQIYDLQGGINAWSGSKKPVVK